MRYAKTTTFSLFFVSCALFSSAALAFESSSASFEIHAGDIEMTTGTSTSASFGLHNAGGQTAVATSTGSTMSIASGILYWFYGLFTARYDQIHYRWRNDDNTEANATFSINEDTQYASFPKNTVKRVRFEMSNEGRTRGAAPVFTLEVAETTTCSSGTYAAVSADYSGHWHIATSTQFVDGSVTTNVADGLTDENASFVAGEIKDTGNTTSAITLSSSDFTEIEFAVMALDAATNGGTYCFRLTNGGATSGSGYVFTYSQYAKAVVGSGLPISGALDSAVFDTFDGGGANKGPAYNSMMWNGTEGSGKIRFQLATSDSSSGPWNFYGSSDGGVTCNSSTYYDTLTSGAGGGPGKPVEVSCGPTYHNGHRYFRYRVQICSSNCSAAGDTSPVVSSVVVNWAP